MVFTALLMLVLMAFIISLVCGVTADGFEPLNIMVAGAMCTVVLIALGALEVWAFIVPAVIIIAMVFGGRQ